MNFEIKQCRSCGASIIWTVTHKGKRMPVDAEPTESGNLRLRHEGEKVIAEYPGKEHPSLFEEPDERRFLSHFATCKFADSHRRKEITL